MKDLVGILKVDIGVMTDLTGIQMDVDKNVLLDKIQVSKLQ